MSDLFNTTEQKASYGIGRNLGDQLANNPFQGLDLDALVAGIRDALTGADMQVPPDDINEAFNAINQQMEADQAAAKERFSAEGDAFLKENGERSEVTVTASGLQYEVLTEGKGDTPVKSSTVRTHYHGTLIDGTVFDSSYNRGEPAEFPVGGVIAGWTEALQMMPVGSKWRLYVPHDLAYGERGAGGAIGPYATLIFDVELLDIVA